MGDFMTIQEIKTILGITVTGQDQAITGAIEDAAALIPVKKIDGHFEETVETGYNGIIVLSPRVKDVVLYAVTETTTGASIDLSNITRISDHIYQVYQAGTYKVQYDSASLSRVVDNLIRDITLYELMKLPNREGFLMKTDSRIGESVISWKSDDEFYADIDSRLKRVWLYA